MSKIDKKDVAKHEDTQAGRSVASRSEPFASFHRELDHLFENFLGRAPFGLRPWSGLGSGIMGFGETGTMIPNVDVQECDKCVTVTAELPGMEEKNVALTLKNGALSLKGEKQSETEKDTGDMHVHERRYGKFERSFRLPEGIDEANADATFENGVLKVVLPKLEKPEGTEKKIKIAAK